MTRKSPGVGPGDGAWPEGGSRSLSSAGELRPGGSAPQGRGAAGAADAGATAASPDAFRRSTPGSRDEGRGGHL